jgi:hypothetical protein
MPLYHGSGLSVSFLPGALLFLSLSRLGATPPDEVHDAFMTPAPYTRTREDEGQMVESGARKQLTQHML